MIDTFQGEIEQARAKCSREHFVHVPTPGDHYSPATGSAIMTIIYEFTRQHARLAGRSDVIVAAGTRHDYEVGKCIEVPFRPLPTRAQRLADFALAAAGLRRRYAEAPYRQMLQILPRNFAGSLFLWNSPACVLLLREHYPNAAIYLYAQNELFRSYSRGEIARVVQAADVVLCCSEFIAESIKQRIPSALQSRVFGIINGVDTSSFNLCAEPNRVECPVVLFVGRVVPQKGPDLLIKAACKAYSRSRKFRLRIVGSSGFNAADALTSYEKELRRIAAPLGSMVEFQPFQDRHSILEEYRRAQIFCVPSNWDEPCSLTVGEGMACGLPVIASRRGGIPEVGGDAVLYFTPPDTEELARQLMLLLDDVEARSEWGRRARVRAQTLSWENQYLKLRSILQLPPPSPRLR